MTYRDPKYSAWLDEASIRIKESIDRVRLGKMRPPFVLVIDVFGGKGWTKSRDLDNVIKATQDVLVATRVIADDTTAFITEIEASYFERQYPNAPARVVVELVEK